MTRLLPTISFQLRNVSAAPLSSVQVNVLFRRAGDQAAWSDVFRRAVTTNRALASGTTTEPIIIQSPVGYTGDEAATRPVESLTFRRSTSVAIYARHGSDDWNCLGEYPLPRHIVGRQVGLASFRQTTTAYRRW